MLSRSPVIIQDARLEIGDAPLMLISMMWQRSIPLASFHLTAANNSSLDQCENETL
jgi:hypothetical protein